MSGTDPDPGTPPSAPAGGYGTAPRGAEAGPPPQERWFCRNHPDREVGVRCSRCERPICPDCMIQASVGFHCPQCVRGAPPVHRGPVTRPDPIVTYAIIAVNVALFLPSLRSGALQGSGNPLADDYALVAGHPVFGFGVAAGEWWRIVSSGFLHYGLIHLGFNMLILYQLGHMLEPAFGRLRFALVYAAGLLGGSFGALLLTPNGLTAGASGAVFGLMGAAVVAMRRQGVNPMQSGIGGLLLINIVLTFTMRGISIGGHLGGLLGGALAAALVIAAAGPDPRRRALGAVGAAAVGAAAFAGSLVTATTPLWPF